MLLVQNKEGGAEAAPHPPLVCSRSDFVLKLSQLREHWQGAVRRAEQRRSWVEGLVEHWHVFGRSLRKLQRFLSEARALLPSAGPARCSPRQLRSSLRGLQVRRTAVKRLHHFNYEIITYCILLLLLQLTCK